MARKRIARTGSVGEILAPRLEQLLERLGEGQTDSVPYDTAWLARLAARFPSSHMAGTLPWLRRQQHADGSWGGAICHYHDRFINTLAAVIALREAGRYPGDSERVRRGIRYLWQNVGRLSQDAHDTIAYSLLAPMLVTQARTLDLSVPTTVNADEAVIAQKLRLLGSDPDRWSQTTMAFSMEAVFPHVADKAIFARTTFIEANGSVGASPAATAAYLLHAPVVDPRALAYLKQEIARREDGGAANLNPMEVYEIAWSLHYLHLSGLISPQDPVVQRLLNVLWQRWQPEKGITFNEFFPVPDLDDTAVVFALLRWGGYPVSADVFRHFEAESYFRCYAGEADPSLSVNIRTLSALETEREHPRYPIWRRKIRRMLRDYAGDHPLWFDKWHISPYYFTSVALWTPAGHIDGLLDSRVKWLLHTQSDDGGWGYHGQSTPEETAYCLQALAHWHEHRRPLSNPAALDQAARYLEQNQASFARPAQYIGKVLYFPALVVEAVITAALGSYYRLRSRQLIKPQNPAFRPRISAD